MNRKFDGCLEFSKHRTAAQALSSIGGTVFPDSVGHFFGILYHRTQNSLEPAVNSSQIVAR
jgi:hypothetical protein